MGKYYANQNGWKRSSFQSFLRSLCIVFHFAYGLIGLPFVPTAVLILSTFAAVLTIGQLGSRVKGTGESPTNRMHRDDDRYWRGGQIYVNRDDPAWFVPRRFGYGYTINVGHPGSWVALIALIVVLMGLPFLLSH